MPPDPYGQPSDPYGQGWGAPPPSGPMPSQGGGGSKTGIIVLVAVLVVGVVAAGAFFLLTGDDDSGSPEGTIEAAIGALADGDCDRYMTYLTEQAAQGEGCDPEDDAIQLVSTDTIHEDDSMATVVTTVNSSLDGGESVVAIDLVNNDGDWLIDGFNPADTGGSEPSGGGEEASGEPGLEPLPEDEGLIEPEEAPTAPPPPDDAPSDPSGGTESPGTAGPRPAGSPDDCSFGGAEAECEGWADACHSGDMVACDNLYANTDVGSAYEDYGATCGGRSAEWMVRQCESTFGPQV